MSPKRRVPPVTRRGAPPESLRGAPPGLRGSRDRSDGLRRGDASGHARPMASKDRLVIIEKRKARARNLRIFIAFFAITALTLLLITTILRKNQPAPRFQFIQPGRIVRTVEATALIVRDEVVLLAQDAGQWKPLAAEGVRVSANDRVAMVIRPGMESTITELENCEQQIAQIQLELIEQGSAPAAQAVYEEVNGEIAGIVRLLRKDAAGGILGNNRQYASSLELLIEARESRLQEIDFKDARLDQLASQRDYLSSILGENAGAVFATAPGIVSYRTDGMETRLDASAVESMTPETLASLLTESSGFVPVGTTVSAGSPVARISNGLIQYLVFYAQNAEPDWFEVGGRHTVSVVSEGIDIEECYVSSVSQSRDGVLVALYTDRQVARLFDRRVADCSITLPARTVEGLQVPVEALVEEAGETSIFLNESGFARRAAVKVLDRDRTRAIIEPKGEDPYKVEVSSIVIVNPESVVEGDKVG